MANEEAACAGLEVKIQSDQVWEFGNGMEDSVGIYTWLSLRLGSAWL